jgi:hypothetical protein
MSTTLKLVQWAERTVTILIAEGLEFIACCMIEQVKYPLNAN